MKNHLVILLTAFPLISTQATEMVQLDAHEHGVGEMNIAIDNNQLTIELHAPGADIVGFEYAATRKIDLEAIETALGILSKPLMLFSVPDKAECVVKDAVAKLESEANHDDDHDDHDDDHDDHDEDHDDHDDHDEDHDDHDGGEHTEFHAEYLLECASMKAMTTITFSYFDAFASAVELDVKMISPKGAYAFEVSRSSNVIDLTDKL